MLNKPTRPLPNLARPESSIPPSLRTTTARSKTIPNLKPDPHKRVKAPTVFSKSIISFPSDKNGCGFYRTIIPFDFLTSSQEYNITSLFTFMFDFNFLVHSNTLRFQRQVTDAQLRVMAEYKTVIAKTGANTKMVYEIDDLVHAIEMNNIMAYQYYTPSRRRNLVQGMRLCDTVTVSTQYLADYYQENFDINNITVIPNYLPKFLWADKGKRPDKYSKKGEKPRILWAGSASHVGKGGDLEFLLPLIKKTKNEFQWVFFGVIPPELKDKPEYEFYKWTDFLSYPAALDAINADFAICPIKDNVFNYAKSDLKVLEYTALGLPSISSSIGNGIGPYDLIPDVCAIENDADLWYQTIKDMATDESMANDYLVAGQNELDQRWLENPENIKKYLDIYK